MTIEEIIFELNKLANPDKVTFKEQKFGVVSNNALGIYHSDLKKMAKKIPKDNELAIQLFDTNIYEARLLCSKIFNPKNLTTSLMEKWVSTFENWEICDSFCMGLFAKSKFAVSKSIEWTKRTKEFEKRAGFTIMAAYCMADKNSTNEIFEQFFPIIIREATDERLYVKKAVNWALRNLGKRNIDLKKLAINCSKQLLKIDSKSAKWIAKDALKELEKPNVRMSDYPREIYRKPQ
jgi:3-methyladenine DNA glycosylase AlkD